jgi:hypothetical protein
MSDYLNLGDVCREQLAMQAQYGSRFAFIEWADEYPFCGEGLRFKGDSDDYHSVKIHKDDVFTFVARVNAIRQW